MKRYLLFVFVLCALYSVGGTDVLGEIITGVTATASSEETYDSKSVRVAMQPIKAAGSP